MKQFNLLFILFIVFTACNNNSNKENVLSNKKNQATNLKSVKSKNIDTTVIKMTEGSMIFKPTKIKLEVIPSLFKDNEIDKNAVHRIFNGENFPISFGRGFQIEKLIDKEWRKVPFHPNAITLKIMLGLLPGQQKELPFGLAYLFEPKNLGPGQYRLIKTVMKKEDLTKKINLKAYFEIH